jgi:hypothetical protein
MNQQTVRHDPIVEEIHATRERLADQYHNNLLAYSKAVEAHCLSLGFQIVEDAKHRASEDVGATAAHT